MDLLIYETLPMFHALDDQEPRGAAPPFSPLGVASWLANLGRWAGAGAG